LNLPANDIIWNPNTQQIYASLPSSFGPNGNSVAVINPTKGTVSGYYYVGSEPNQLALSADGSYLYVGLNGNGSIQRMVLPSFALDINIPLGTIEYGGVNTAGAIQVSPSNSHTIAVALSSAECCGYGGPLEFFTDTTHLPDSITYPDVSSIQFVSGTTLYGYYSSQLIEVTVNSSGGTVAQQWNDMITGSSIAYDAGLIYGNGGQVFNPVTSDLVGSYDVGSNDYGSGEDLLPESAVNSTFVVGISPFFSSLGITSYNLSHFTPTAVINLSQLSGTVSAPFISWGTNGLAFVIGNGCCGTGTYQTVLVQSSMMEQHSTKH
jgi:hypothetical protein